VTRPYLGVNGNGYSFTVSGIFNFNANGYQGSMILAPVEPVRDWIRLPSGSTSLIIRVDGDPDKRAKEIEAYLKTLDGFQNATVKSWTQVGMAKYYIDMFNVSMVIMAIIFFALASTVLINTVIMIIYERKKEIGALSALGMEGIDLIRMFFLEAVFMSMIGALTGIAAGVLASVGLDALRIDYGSMMGEVDFDMPNIMTFAINWKSTILVFVFSVAVSALTSLVPVQKAAKIEPVEALRDD
jgi:putative ABC transport system permease protein